VAWSLPPDPQFAVLAAVPPALAALLVAVGGLFAFEAAKGRVALRGKAAAALLGGTLAAAVGLALLVRALGQGTLAMDSWRVLGSLAPAARLLALALSFPIALFALFLLFLWPARRLRWPEAYFALAAGPGLGAILVILKVIWPRVPPGAQAFFAGPMAFPNDLAALVPALALLLTLLRSRLTGKRTSPAWLLAASLVAVAVPLAAGQAWPSDVLAGLLLGLAWFGLCRMGLLLAEGALAHPSLLTAALETLDALVRKAARRAAPWLLGIIGAGVALRIASYWWSPLAVDAYSYAVMAHSFLRDGSFTMPWGDVDTYLTAPVPSHHYPPFYPMYLAAFYKLLGFSQSTTHIASIATSLAALLVTWLCTRDLYGKRPALVTTAIVAISPLLVQNTGQGYSENLVLLLFVATLWAILKSLDRPWFIVPAGLLAGIGYLTKSSMGYFFILAGLGGLGWRLYWKGLKVLKDPAYLVAIAGFGAMVAVWAARNYLLFGSWETSQHISEAYHTALAHPGAWAFRFLVTLVFYATVGYLLYLAALPWLPTLVRTPKLGSEHDSGLWLALGLPLLLTSAIDAALWLIEKEFFLNNVRYVSFVTVPLAWLLLRHARWDARATRLALLATVVLLLSGSLFFAKPSTAYNQAIADDWAPRMADGDSVGFVDGNNHFAYRYYFQLTHGGTREVPVIIACLGNPLCPGSAPRPEAFNTTWVLAPNYATGHLPSAYAPVPGAFAAPDPSHPDRLVLWRRA
jgi:4-amino-4-deoxy-L-arabinose transferase-like glycosyltransferase